MWAFCDECGSMVRPSQSRCPVCGQPPGTSWPSSDERAAARWLSIFTSAVMIAGSLLALAVSDPRLLTAIIALSRTW